MRLLWENLVDLAATTITGSSENSALPVENIAHAHRQKVWRTGSSSGAESVSFDFGSAKAVSALVILDHDLLATDTALKLEFSDASDFGSIVATFNLEWREDAIRAFFAAVSCRYARVTWTKASASTRQIGRIFLGDHYECDEQPMFDGYDDGLVDLSKSDRSLGGTEYSDIRQIFREFKCDFSQIIQEQADAFIECGQDCGTHTPFFIIVEETILDDDQSRLPLDEVLYVKFKSVPKRKTKGVDETLLWDVSLDFEEQI